MTTSFHSKVGIFTPLRLNPQQLYHVRIAKLIGFGRGAAPRAQMTCDVNWIVIEITSHLCLKPLNKTSGAVFGGATPLVALPLEQVTTV